VDKLLQDLIGNVALEAMGFGHRSLTLPRRIGSMLGHPPDFIRNRFAYVPLSDDRLLLLLNVSEHSPDLIADLRRFFFPFRDRPRGCIQLVKNCLLLCPRDTLRTEVARFHPSSPARGDQSFRM
jgi:hypothetical protein